ncbi:MAG: outer membrane beta-barrel protein [Gammaproteobacteria bacterium]|nr:outer membrane beta-barrel protein [Gammaproteobacteria bacterium]
MANARKFVAASLLAATLAVPAVASAHWLGPSGLYVGAGGGFARNKDFAQGLTVPFTNRNRGHAAWKAFLGYSFGPFFAIQASYENLGGSSVTTPIGETRVQERGYNFDGIINIPIVHHVSVFGEAGAARFHTRTTTPVSVVRKWNGYHPDYGAGVQYDITQYVALRGEWQEFRIPHNDTQLYSGSLLFHF